MSAGGHNVNWWPLAAKHVGERKLRQLRALGYPVGDLLQFGTQAFALRKWWHHRYEQWRDIRELAIALGPDACSTLTTTNYFLQAVESGRYFFRRDDTKLVAMTIPAVFRKLNLAKENDVWLVEMALYDLTTSPKDWGICRDSKMPKLSWKRLDKDGTELTGHFEKSQDDNLWRLIEVGGGERHWRGLLMSFVHLCR